MSKKTARNSLKTVNQEEVNANGMTQAQDSFQNQQIQAPRQSQQQTKMVYILQTQADGTQVLLPHPNYNQQQSQQQIVRMVQQKVLPQQQTQQIIQQTQHNIQQVQQQQQQHQERVISLHRQKLIATLDVARVLRSQTQDLLRRQEQQIQKPSTVSQSIASSSSTSAKSDSNQFQSRLTELEVPERKSAKMLVILDTGELRLITFILPKETCAVQELLDQVGIQVGADSSIECIKNPGSEIDYIVKVGNVASRNIAALIKVAENHIRQEQLNNTDQAQC